MTTINTLALECAIISSTSIVEQLDRISVHAEGEETEKVRSIRKKFLAAREELYALSDAAKDAR